MINPMVTLLFKIWFEAVDLNALTVTMYFQRQKMPKSEHKSFPSNFKVCSSGRARTLTCKWSKSWFFLKNSLVYGFDLIELNLLI